MKEGDASCRVDTCRDNPVIASSTHGSNAALTVLSAGAAIILCGCNLDTRNYLWPTYEYQHQGRTRAQEHEFLKKTYPNDPGLWQ